MIKLFDKVVINKTKKGIVVDIIHNNSSDSYIVELIDKLNCIDNIGDRILFCEWDEVEKIKR